MKEFLLTIPSEANDRMVKNSFPRAKGGWATTCIKPTPFPSVIPSVQLLLHLINSC
jgi:hypothetical protein